MTVPRNLSPPGIRSPTDGPGPEPIDMNALSAWRKPLFPSRRKPVVATLVAAASAALAACEPPQQAFTPPPAEVGALEVQPRDLPLSLEYAAQLRGVREVEV